MEKNKKNGQKEISDDFSDDFSEEDKRESKLNLWNYKEVSQVIGFVISIDEGRFGGRSITLKTEQEEIVLPELTALNSQLKSVEVGDKVKITYGGDVKADKSNRMYATFDVFIKRHE